MCTEVPSFPRACFPNAKAYSSRSHGFGYAETAFLSLGLGRSKAADLGGHLPQTVDEETGSETLSHGFKVT